MGDWVAITTWPRHQNLFYLASSNGLMFELKATGNAAVGLAKQPGPKVDYWIGIAENSRCWIKREDQLLKSVPVQNLLSMQHYTKFWLQWNVGTIKLGLLGEQRSIIMCTNKIPDLKYITFSVLNQNGPVHWRFELPPPKIKLSPSYKPINSGKLRWVVPDDQLPDDALIGGFENEMLYIIRAPHQGSVTPGKFVPSEGGGYVSWGGNAHEKGEFEVLCGHDCKWVPTVADQIPAGAFIGGYSENAAAERLYVGRAVHNGHVIPGKVQPSFRACLIPYEGQEIVKKMFEILVEPSELRSSNRAYFLNMPLEYEVPPLRPQLPLKPMACGKLQWVGADRQALDGAVIGGFEKDTLYIIRAGHSGSVTVGKYLPSEAAGYIPWGGAAHKKLELEMLVGHDCAWVRASENQIPVGAFAGGYSEDRHETLFVGRAFHEGHIIPGKVQPSHRVCYIPYEGREIAKKQYEILVEPGDKRSAHRHYFSETYNGQDSDSDQDYENDGEMMEYESNDDLDEVMAL